MRFKEFLVIDVASQKLFDNPEDQNAFSEGITSILRFIDEYPRSVIIEAEENKKREKKIPKAKKDKKTAKKGAVWCVH